MNEFLPSIYEKLEALEREELIQEICFFRIQYHVKYYENSKDLNDLSSKRQL